MKNVLQINGVIQKIDENEISEKEMEFIQDEILAILEKHNYMYGGSWKHQTTEDYLKDLETQNL